MVEVDPEDDRDRKGVPKIMIDHELEGRPTLRAALDGVFVKSYSVGAKDRDVLEDTVELVFKAVHFEYQADSLTTSSSGIDRR